MIVKRIWLRDFKSGLHVMSMEVHGYFLFGIIPLYIADVRTI